MRPSLARDISATTRYTVIERLGAGALATMHRAIEHRADGSELVVALVLLRPQLADDVVDEFVRRATELSRIHQVGRGTTGWFLSMEYVPGCDFGWLLGGCLADGSVDTDLP